MMKRLVTIGLTIGLALAPAVVHAEPYWLVVPPDDGRHVMQGMPLSNWNQIGMFSTKSECEAGMQSSRRAYNDPAMVNEMLEAARAQGQEIVSIGLLRERLEHAQCVPESKLSE